MSKPQIVTFIVEKSGKTKSFNDLTYDERCKIDKIIKDSIILYKGTYLTKGKNN